MLGVTALGEGVFGVDLATNEALTREESFRRAVQGGSTIVIVLAGPKALDNAQQRTLLSRVVAGGSQGEAAGLRLSVESARMRGWKLTGRQVKTAGNTGNDLVVMRERFGVLRANREYGVIEAKSGSFRPSKTASGRQASGLKIQTQLDRAMTETPLGLRGFLQRRFIATLQEELEAGHLVSMTGSAADRQFFELNLGIDNFTDFRLQNHLRTAVPAGSPVGTGTLNNLRQGATGSVLIVIVEDED